MRDHLKKMAFLAAGLMLMCSATGCQAIKDGLKVAEDTLLAPPDTVVAGAKLGLDFILGILSTFARGLFGGILGV